MAVKRVIVAGAGELGMAVARALMMAANSVTVVELEASVAAQLPAAGLEVVHGDAAVPSTLERAGALRADVVVACTGRDEVNLVICLLARSHFEVPRVVARVNDPENGWLFDQSWGVDAAVSAVASLIAQISEASGAAATVQLAQIAGTDVAVTEVAIEEGARGVGTLVADLTLPPFCSLAALVRGGRPLPLDPGVRLAVGDRLVVVVNGAGGTQALNQVFYPVA